MQDLGAPPPDDVRTQPTRIVILPGVGHWTQQEAPAEVNAAILEFLLGL